MQKSAKKGRGYSTLQLVLLSFGFFSVTILWGLYNSYVPLILDRKLGGFALSSAVVSTLTGFIMTIDNIFGVIFQPIFGRKSDAMRSRWGKRLPYLIVGMPLCAVFFALIPIVSGIDGTAGILAMMLVIILFNFVMSTWRAPCVALMPDLVPAEYQSDGNAIVNMMASVAGIISAFSATLLGFFGLRDSINSGDFRSVFFFGSCVTILCLVILLTCVRWKDNRQEALQAAQAQGGGKPKESLLHLNLPHEVKVSLFAMMASLFFLSAASDGFGTYYTLYATKTLGLTASLATLLKIGGVLAAFLLAVPAGVCGRRFGRKRTITVSLFGIMLASFLMLILGSFPEGVRLPLLALALFIYYGTFIMINVNTLPMMLAIGGKERFGAFTGYYYTATFTASAIIPTILGFFIGLLGYGVLHIFNIAAMLAVFFILRIVKHGEQLNAYEEKELEAAAKEADAD